MAIALLLRIVEEAAMQRKRCPQGGFRHGRAHGRVDHARQGYLRQAGIVQQAIDAGPERLDQAQPGQALQGAWRRVGNHGGDDAPGVLRRDVQVPAGIGHGALQLDEPGVAFFAVEAAAKQ